MTAPRVLLREAPLAAGGEGVSTPPSGSGVGLPLVARVPVNVGEAGGGMLLPVGSAEGGNEAVSAGSGGGAGGEGGGGSGCAGPQ